MKISLFYTSLPKSMIIRCTAPEMWRETDVIVISFWDIPFPFTLLTAQKMKISKHWKKTPGYIIILHKSTKNHNQMFCCSWDIARVGCNCYCSFWAIYNPFTPLTAPKIENFRKMKKTRGNIIHLTQVHQKSWSNAIFLLRYGRCQM